MKRAELAAQAEHVDGFEVIQNDNCESLGAIEAIGRQVTIGQPYPYPSSLGRAQPPAGQAMCGVSMASIDARDAIVPPRRA